MRGASIVPRNSHASFKSPTRNMSTRKVMLYEKFIVAAERTYRVAESRRGYWLDLFTGTTWKEFLDAGATVSGFRESRWNVLQQIRPGDYLLCYLTGISRFVGILEAVSEPFTDTTRIWKDEVFPSRIHVRIVVALEPETAVLIHELRDRLSIFRNLKSPAAWADHVIPIRFDGHVKSGPGEETRDGGTRTTLCGGMG